MRAHSTLRELEGNVSRKLPTDAYGYLRTTARCASRRDIISISARATVSFFFFFFFFLFIRDASNSSVFLFFFIFFFYFSRHLALFVSSGNATHFACTDADCNQGEHVAANIQGVYKVSLQFQKFTTKANEKTDVWKLVQNGTYAPVHKSPEQLLISI